MDAVGEFYRRGAEKAEGGALALQVGGDEIPYSFADDANILYADFRRVYGIDLSTAELHWYEFMALLEGLYSNTFAERVHARVCDLTKCSKYEVDHLREMREKYHIARPGEEAGPMSADEYWQTYFDQIGGESE